MKEYFVTNQLELKQALVSAAKNNEVATINLAGGNYGSFTMNSKYDKEYPAVRGLDFNNVTIRSADESNRATFDKISIKGYDNLTFDSLNVHLTQYTAAVSISDAKNVIFQNSDIRGLGVDPATWTPEHGVNNVAKMSGISVTFSENVAVKNNSIQEVAWGTFAKDMKGYVLSGNTFENNYGDNSRFGSNLQDISIDANTYYGTKGKILIDGELLEVISKNHTDNIQLWQVAYDHKYPSNNISITNNTIINNSLESATTQLIFGRSELFSAGNLEALYKGHFIVTGNTVYGGSSHGVSIANLAGGPNQIFANNVAIWNGVGSVPAIRSSGSGDVTFENNIAGAGFNGQADKNFLINYSDPNLSNYFGKVFVNAQKPLTEITAKDLQFSPDFYQNFGKAMGFPEPSYADDGFVAHIVYRDAENNDTSTSGFEQLKTFDASYSTGEDGKPLGDNATYKWVFEDGTEKFGKIVTHSITDGGAENVKLFVTVDGKTVASEKLLKLFDTHVFSADFNGKLLDDSNTVTTMSWKGEEDYRVMEDGERAAEFNGTNYIQLDRLGNTQDFFNAKEFTIAATVSLDAANLKNVNTVINSHTKFSVRIEGGDTITVGIGSALKFKGANFADGKEHQIVTTVDGNQVTVYFDGQSLGTQTISQQGIATMGSWAVEIGFTPFKTWGLQGTIRDVEVLRKSVSADELDNLGGSGKEGDNSASGGDGDDTITGGSESSTIDGLDGSDKIEDNQDGDTLWGNKDNDTLIGGIGNDLIGGDEGADSISGGAGHDTLWGGRGRDTLEGSDGNDLIGGGKGADSISGGAGHDTLWGGRGIDTLEGSDGNDLIGGGEGADSLSGGAGHDTLWGGMGRDTLDGGVGNDLLSGERGKDTYVFNGAYGNDTIHDDDGDLIINDTTISGTANAVSGQAGQYLIVIGGQTFDVSWAGDLQDAESRGSLTLKSQHDDLNSITIINFKNGTYGITLAVNGGKHIIDTTSNDSGSNVTGAEGNDTLEGKFGEDTLNGGYGDDLLRGGADRDFLYGGEGNDTLIGGRSSDMLFGGEGADHFVFQNILHSGRTQQDIDAIMDFKSGQDKIDMSALSFTGIEAYNANQEAVDGILTYVLKGDRLEVSDKNSMFKFHVLGADNLTASDFLF